MGENSKTLFEKLLDKECSEAEVRRIVAVLANSDENSIYDDLILAQLTRKVNDADLPTSVKLNLNARLQHILHAEINPLPARPGAKRIHFPIFRYLAIAASLIAVLTVAYLFKDSKKAVKNKSINQQVAQDIAPGKDEAVLTLADGRKILLTDKKNGELARAAGISINKAADGKLVYTIDSKNAGSGAADMYNTITTPRGGQYQVNLPDGTKVWLNSASSIHFPMMFSAAGKRMVKLSGEAYFEVEKDKKRPFVVSSGKQTLEVLGTHFNISSYPEDAGTKTTLLEGAVKITAGQQTAMLHPGEEADVTSAIRVAAVDAESAIAWKNGFFRFDDEELESVMNKIARWYDLDVEFKDATLKHELLAAYSTRFAKVSQLLKQLNQIGDAQFTLEERKIIITRKK